MSKGRFLGNQCSIVMVILFFFILGCSPSQTPQSGGGIPVEYANKHMPTDYWGNQNFIEEGRQLYLGNGTRKVNCAQCHGKTGKPIKGGARNFRDTKAMKKLSDSHLLWRIAEGVSFTTMVGFKGSLSEDQMWKVIAYISTMGLNGLQYDQNTKSWVPLR